MTISGFVGLVTFSVNGVVVTNGTVNPVDQEVEGKGVNNLDANGPGGGGGTGTGNMNFTAAETPPDDPNPGDQWLNTDTGVQFEWFEDGDSGQWVEWVALDGGGSRGVKYFSQDTPPGAAIAGDQWFDTSTGVQYVLFDDGDSTQWVEHF